MERDARLRDRRGLVVVQGGGTEADAAALSFVHRRWRIDVPADAILGVEPIEYRTWFLDGGRPLTSWSPSVELRLRADVLARLRRLTPEIVGEPVDVVVAGECVTSPVVCEPLGGKPVFFVSTGDMAEAETLARRLRPPRSRPLLRLVR